MPWDGTELWTGTIGDDGSLEQVGLVTGGVNESIFQPEWSPDGTLYFVSDRTGWWNLYRVGDAGDVEAVHEREAELGVPQWGFGMSTYAFESADRDGLYLHRKRHLASGVDRHSNETFTPLETPYTDIRYLRAAPGEVVIRAGSPTEAAVDCQTRSENRKSRGLAPVE